jgi:pimeloyl-ACP methyl ester carboxylesterase
MTTENTVAAQDGTPISYLTHGSGPGLVVIPGAARTARDYDRLAAALGERFTVHVIDRRGRGSSGPQGDGYSIESEIGDLEDVLRRTESACVFGHSYGGLVALQAARRSTRIRHLAVYEPAVSVDGSFDLSWVDGFARQVERRRPANAIATFFASARLLPGNLPRWMLVPLMRTMFLTADGRQMRDLLPTMVREIREVERLDSDGAEYGAITAPTLLMGGAESPGYLTGVLPRLSHVIPDARVAMLDGVGHNAPDMDDPETVAGLIAVEFLAEVPPRR